jgi:subtilisin family serine protease
MSSVRQPQESRLSGAALWPMAVAALPYSSASTREPRAAHPLELVNLRPLMELTQGNPEVVVALLDGPVLATHPDLSERTARALVVNGEGEAPCRGPACTHGTFIAGILSARRGSDAPAICPECTLMVRPIFSDAETASALQPSALPQQLAAAIAAAVDAGARILNLSAALLHLPSAVEERALTAALDYAARRGAIVVAAAGNQRQVGTTTITRHPAVLPVSACDRHGRPLPHSNLGHSTALHGVTAPGTGIRSLSANGGVAAAGGTSVAAPFVAGALALVWSEFPRATADDLRMALVRAHGNRRRTVVPPLLNAMAVYEAMMSRPGRRGRQ